MSVARRAAVLVLGVLLVGGCSTDDGEGPAAPDDAAEVSTTVPAFTGDPDSPFCEALESGDERPVLDPFEPGLDAREVEIRLRALRLRFEELAATAPAELGDDLDALDVALASLDETLAEYGYDFETAAAAGADLSAFDAPEFADVAARVDGYRTQVCGV